MTDPIEHGGNLQILVQHRLAVLSFSLLLPMQLVPQVQTLTETRVIFAPGRLDQDHQVL